MCLLNYINAGQHKKTCEKGDFYTYAPLYTSAVNKTEAAFSG